MKSQQKIIKKTLNYEIVEKSEGSLATFAKSTCSKGQLPDICDFHQRRKDLSLCMNVVNTSVHSLQQNLYQITTQHRNCAVLNQIQFQQDQVETLLGQLINAANQLMSFSMSPYFVVTTQMLFNQEGALKLWFSPNLAHTRPLYPVFRRQIMNKSIIELMTSLTKCKMLCPVHSSMVHKLNQYTQWHFLGLGQVDLARSRFNSRYLTDSFMDKRRILGLNTSRLPTSNIRRVVQRIKEKSKGRLNHFSEVGTIKKVLHKASSQLEQAVKGLTTRSSYD